MPEGLAETTVQAAIAMATGNVAAAGAVSATAAAPGAFRDEWREDSHDAENRVDVRRRVDRNRGGLRDKQRPLECIRTRPPALESSSRNRPRSPKPGRTLHLDVSSAADGSPLAGATVWVRHARPYLHLGGYDRRPGAVRVVLPGQLATLDILVAPCRLRDIRL